MALADAKELRLALDDNFWRIYRSLYIALRDEFYWWEVANVVRELCLLMAILIADPMLKYAAVLTVLLIYRCATLHQSGQKWDIPTSWKDTILS